MGRLFPSIRAKFLIFTAVMLLGIAAVAAVFFLGVNRTIDESQAAFASHTRSQLALQRIAQSTSHANVLLTLFVTQAGAGRLGEEEAYERGRAILQLLDQSMKSMAVVIDDELPESSGLRRRVISALSEYRSVVASTMALASVDVEGSIKLLERSHTVHNRAADSLHEFIDARTAASSRQLEVRMQTERRRSLLYIAVIALLFLPIAGFTYSILKDVRLHQELEERLYSYVADVEEANGQIKEQAKQLREQAVQLRRARDKAQRATESKSMFLANMSHEIRTPMNGIVGTTDLLMDSSLDSQQHELVDLVRTSSQNLLTIINDILDFSKIESGQLQLDPVPVKLSDVLSGVSALLATAIESKNIDLQVELDRRLFGSFLVDPTRLQQVLVNLLGNAAKFTPALGRITLSAVPVRMCARRAAIRLSVEDTGIGIDENTRKRLFVPFAQADQSTSRMYGGTGLGLSISSQIVELMGGVLEVDSAPGDGSTFYFEIELERVDCQAPVSHRRADVEELRALTVLVAEDNLINQKVIGTILRNAGHDVTLVENGREAVDQYDKQSFDILLMDIQMPVLDGVEAVAEIRQKELNSGTHTPIIAVTAHAMQGDREKYLAAGMDDYLSKPINRDELLEVLQRYGPQTILKGSSAGKSEAAA